MVFGLYQKILISIIFYFNEINILIPISLSFLFPQSQFIEWRKPAVSTWEMIAWLDESSMVNDFVLHSLLINQKSHPNGGKEKKLALFTGSSMPMAESIWRCTLRPTNNPELQLDGALLHELSLLIHWKIACRKVIKFYC